MAEDAQAIPDSKMEEMTEAQILQEMATKKDDAEVQISAMHTLSEQVWPATIALNLNRDGDGQLVGSAGHPVSPWPEVINALVSAMETHPDNAPVIERAILCLLFYYENVCACDAMSSQEPATTFFPRVIKAVIASLRREKSAVKHDADTKSMFVLKKMLRVGTNLEDTIYADGIDVLQLVLLRHTSNSTIILEAYNLLHFIAACFPMELAVSSAMLESLRMATRYESSAGVIIATMVSITDTAPADMAEADAADFLKHTRSNITALRPGVGWILAVMQMHMRTVYAVLFSLKLLINMAENAGSKDMAQCINKGLGFNVVLDIMKRWRVVSDVQLHCAKAVWALLFFGGVETVEEDGRRRASEMLRAAETLFNSDAQLELRTVAKKARELINLDPIEVDDM